MTPDTRSHVHDLVNHLPPRQLAAIETLVETMIEEAQDEEPLSAEDRRALAASREYFEHGGEGIPFEQVVADLGFTIDKIRSENNR